MPGLPPNPTVAEGLTRKTVRFLSALLMLLPGSFVMAGSWDYGANVGLNFNYNDNPTLADDDKDSESLSKMLASYNMDIIWQEPGKRFTFEPRVTRDYYFDSDNSDLENTDFFLPGQYIISRARDSFGVNFDYRERNVLSEDSTILESSDSANFRADDTQTTYGLGINYNLILTPVDQLTFLGRWGKIDFDREFTGRNDSDNWNFSGTYSHNISARQSVGFGLNYSNFEAEGKNCLNFFTVVPPELSFDPCQPTQINAVNNSETDNYSATLNYSVNLTPSLNFIAKFGKQKSESTTSIKDTNGNDLIPSTDTDQDGETYDFALNGDYQRYSFNLSAGRRVRPSTTGSAQNTTTLSLDQEYEITPKLTGKLLLEGIERESVIRESNDTDLADRKRRNYEGRLQLNWKIDRKWATVLRYTFRKKDFDRTATIDSIDATSNQINIGVTYSLKRIKR